MESGDGRSDPRPLTGEEEAVKRNTDCVYFLASPLTCKKGSECEYRHSEGARVNPRDCKFWFSGNCMNPKCLFRHPPLDGLVGNPVATSGPIMTASLVASSMQLPMKNSSAYNLSRNNVPCYYFQNGTCLKGDKCPFKHGPRPAANPVAKQSAKVSSPVEAPKNDAWKIKKCINQQNVSTAQSFCKDSTGKPVNGAPSSAEGSMALENAKIHSVYKSSLLPLPTRNGLPRSQTLHVPLSSSTSFSQPQSLHVQSDRHHLNEREAGEILREPSEVDYTELKRPLNHQLGSSGFDVLVDHVVKDYLHDKDGYGNGSIQGGSIVNHGDGYDHHHSTARLDRDRDSGAGECQHYGKVKNRGGGDGDRHRSSSVSDRILDKPVLPVRRLAHRLRSPDGIDESDLRHRIMKQRRLNGSLSATVSGRESEPYSRHEHKTQDRHTHNSYRDQRQLPENTINSRLRGRITIPRPSSPELLGGGRGRQRDKPSPVRPSSLQGRLGDRLSVKPIDDSSNARNFGSQHKARDALDPLDFAGPRSLAELKGSQGQQSTKNSHSISSLAHSEMKPPSTLPEYDVISGVGIGGFEAGSCAAASEAAPASELQSSSSLETSLEGAKVVHIPAEVEQLTYEKQAAEDETETGDASGDEELDYTDQRDREYDYETAEGGDPMNIDDDDEDEDDFAKKIGLIFS